MPSDKMNIPITTKGIDGYFTSMSNKKIPCRKIKEEGGKATVQIDLSCIEKPTFGAYSHGELVTMESWKFTKSEQIELSNEPIPPDLIIFMKMKGWA